MRVKTKKPVIWSLGICVVLLLIVFISFKPVFTKNKLTHVFTNSFGDQILNRPIDAVIIDKIIFVSDSGKNRIVKFNLKGEFLGSFGKEGNKLGELNRPMHVSSDHAGNILVSEFLNDRIQVFSKEGKSIRIIGKSGNGPGEFDAPAAAVVDTKGNIYVADFYNQRIQKLSQNGTFMTQWGLTRSKSIKREQFNYPTDIEFFPDGGFVVADAYNDRVKVYDHEGTLDSVFGGFFGLNIPGSWKGWFNVATGVSISPTELIYVSDFYNHRIQVFTRKGHFISVFGQKGSGQGQLNLPTDVAFGPNGEIYVIDYGNNRIQRWTIK